MRVKLTSVAPKDAPVNTESTQSFNIKKTQVFTGRSGLRSFRACLKSPTGSKKTRDLPARVRDQAAGRSGARKLDLLVGVAARGGSVTCRQLIMQALPG